MTQEHFDDLVETAHSDDAILGLILYGSRGAGAFVREESDWDVWLTVRDDVLTSTRRGRTPSTRRWT